MSKSIDEQILTLLMGFWNEFDGTMSNRSIDDAVDAIKTLITQAEKEARGGEE